MNLLKIAGLPALLLATSTAFALDSACSPIVSASEAKIKQAAWHSVTVVNKNFRMEYMKVGGKFYRQMNGTWSNSTINYDNAERDMVAQIRSGEVKLSKCKASGMDIVDGVPVSIVTYTVEMKGAPAAESKLYIGKLDGLPYKQVGNTVDVTYKYKGVSAPKI